MDRKALQTQFLKKDQNLRTEIYCMTNKHQWLMDIDFQLKWLNVRLVAFEVWWLQLDG